METPHPLNTEQDKTDFFLLSIHELRTSLTAMKWLFKMLNDGDYGPLTTEQCTAIERASHSTETMVKTINTTIAMLKSEEAVTFAQLPIHLAHLIAEIVNEFTNEANQKHLALTYHQSATPIIILGDEPKLRIAFHNIIENAIKYSMPDTEVVISISTESTMAMVIVQDHGIGIPEAQSTHVFERFFRASNVTESGTGLGLYSTKLIIERHNGTIALSSTEGQGSTVTIALPLHI